MMWGEGFDEAEIDGERALILAGIGEKEKLPSTTSLLRKDEQRPQNLTTPTDIEQFPFKEIVENLEPIVHSCVRSIGTINGRSRQYYEDDLRAVAYEALWKARAKFEGR